MVSLVFSFLKQFSIISRSFFRLDLFRRFSTDNSTCTLSCSYPHLVLAITSLAVLSSDFCAERKVYTFLFPVFSMSFPLNLPILGDDGWASFRATNIS